MGWWQTDVAGHSFGGPPDEQPDMCWGDGPADVLSSALDDVARQYVAAWGRQPTLRELRAGLEFALLGQDGGVAYDERYSAAQQAQAAAAEDGGG